MTALLPGNSGHGALSTKILVEAGIVLAFMPILNSRGAALSFAHRAGRYIASFHRCGQPQIAFRHKMMASSC